MVSRRCKIYPQASGVSKSVLSWIADWMNHQLSDIGVTSTGGVALPPFHFELVTVNNDVAAAHTFEAAEWGFIVMTQPMFDEMLRLSRLVVAKNAALFSLQIAPSAGAEEIAQLLLLMQFCFVSAHEYSHLVRQHLEDHPPHAEALGAVLSQAQEMDADGYGIYHDLPYFFSGAGRPLASHLLKMSSAKSLESAILSCFLLAGMIQFCARWAGNIQIESDVSAEYHTVSVLVCPKLAGDTRPIFDRQVPSPLVAGDSVLTVERETFLQTDRHARMITACTNAFPLLVGQPENGDVDAVAR